VTNGLLRCCTPIKRNADIVELISRVGRLKTILGRLVVGIDRRGMG